MGAIEYPEAVYQTCFKICAAEEVDVGGGRIDLWDYCEICDIETFHAIPYHEIYYPNNLKEED